MAKTLRVFTVFTIVSSLIMNSTEATPVHIEGPVDTYVFEGQNATLRCQIENATNVAIVWQYVDGNGQGTFIGKCFSCPSGTCQEEPNMNQNYTITNSGNVYELLIKKASVPSTRPIGLFQCGYLEVTNCNLRTTDKKYQQLHQAIVYVYQDPQCGIALLPLHQPLWTEVEFTCSWGPTFQTSVNATMSIKDATGTPDIVYKQCIISRIMIQAITVNETIAESYCNMTLPNGKMSRSCTFAYVSDRRTSVYINPLVSQICEGDTQEMQCHVKPNNNSERRWTFFRNERNATKQLENYLQFHPNTNEVLILSNFSVIGQYLVKCSVATADGGVASAFATITMDKCEKVSTSFRTTSPSDIVSTASSIQKATDLTPVYIAVVIIIIVISVVVLFIVWKRVQTTTASIGH